MERTRIAVAGAGYSGLKHIRVVPESPSFALSAVVDPSDAAGVVAAKAGVHYRSSMNS